MRPILLSTLLLFISCVDNTDKHKKLIQSFVDEVLINKENISSYIELNSELPSNKKDALEDLMNVNVELLNDVIKKTNGKYKILSHSEVKGKNIDPNFEFDDYSSVYHLIVDKEIITSFILKDDKIVSFSYNMVKNKTKPRTPLLLN